ncbi:MAG: OmpH family outer membrane protein [Gammaproteobacteria bacterium]|nr:OmpH family outer membrane protein [Gammaproteobacteria bacterium]
MRTLLTLWLAAIGTVFLTGCDTVDLGTAAVIPRDTVVIDLDRVADGLGRSEEFQSVLSETNADLTTKLTEYAEGLKAKLEEERAKVGDNPTEESQAELRKLVAQAQQQLRRSQAAAQQQAQQFQAGLYAKFRSEVQPFAEFVARERGARIVLVKNNLLWFDPGSDITDAVVNAMKTAASKSE